MTSLSVPDTLITTTRLSKENKWLYLTLLYRCREHGIFLCTPEELKSLAYDNGFILTEAFTKRLVLDLYQGGFIEIAPSDTSGAPPDDYPLQMFYDGLFRLQTWYITVNNIVI